VGTQIHTSPQAFGKVMSTIKPRQAIGYHFFNEQATHDNIMAGCPAGLFRAAVTGSG